MKQSQPHDTSMKQSQPHGTSVKQSQPHGASTSVKQSQPHGTSVKQSQPHGASTSVKQSQPHGASTGVKQSQPHGSSVKQSQPHGASTSVKQSQPHGASTSVKQSQPHGASTSVKQSQPHGASTSVKQSQPHGTSVKQSQPHGASTSVKQSQPHGTSVKQSQPHGTSVKQSQPHGASTSVKQSQPHGASTGVKQSQPHGSSVKQSQPHGASTSVKQSQPHGASTSVKQSQPHGASTSVKQSQPHGASTSVKQSQPHGTSVKQSQPHGTSVKQLQPHGASTSVKQSQPHGTSVKQSQPHGASTSEHPQGHRPPDPGNSILAQLLVPTSSSSPDNSPSNTIVISDSPCKIKSDETRWIAHLSLYQSDRDILQSGGWLTGNIIHAAQMLLKSQNTKIHGWMDTQCTKRKALFKPVRPGAKFVQILHVNGNHWITVSNVSSTTAEEVQIYDSGSPSNIPISTQAAICSIMRPQSRVLNFDVVNVQAQNNLSDCGLFAIAFAVELVHGNDPAVSHFDVANLRRHLEEGINHNHLDPFPTVKKRRVPFGRKIKLTVKAEIYCTCRTVNDVARSMIQCFVCKKWFHHDCESIDTIESTKSTFKFKCSQCRAIMLL